MKVKSEWTSKKDGQLKQELEFTPGDSGVIISQTPYEDKKGKFSKFKLRVKIDGDSEPERWITLSKGQLKECKKFPNLATRMFKVEQSEPFTVKDDKGEEKTIVTNNLNVQRTQDEWKALKEAKVSKAQAAIMPQPKPSGKGLMGFSSTPQLSPWVKNQEVEKVIQFMVAHKEVFLKDLTYTEFRNGAEYPSAFIAAAKETPELDGLSDSELTTVWNEIKRRLSH